MARATTLPRGRPVRCINFCTIHAHEFTMLPTLLEEARAFAPEIIRLRRHFHAHPELSYHETASTALVADTLRGFGISQLRTGFGPLATGVTADIGKPLGTGAPCIALRADMDALPVTERVDVPWASTVPGVMHACGHDAHMAVLLGAAHLLQQHAAALPGTVRFIFQPGEECLPTDPPADVSGAMFAIRAGVLDGVDAVCGLHVWGTFPANCLLVREGATMMALGRFTLRVNGRGGHGGLPHEAIDPIPVACELVEACQRIISREISPFASALLTFGFIHGGTALNVIPEHVELGGTFRTLSATHFELVRQRLADMADHICRAHRCTAELTILSSDPPVMNDPALASLVRDVGTELLGAERVLHMDPLPASEDFSDYTARKPGLLMFWGMADPARGIGEPQHNPAFQVNDEGLHEAAAVMAATAWRYLADHQ